MTTRATIARGWRVFAGTVLVLALVQAATVAPALTPVIGLWFAVAAFASFTASSAAIAIVAAAARAAADRSGFRWPALSLWAASVLATIAVFAASVVAPALSPIIIVLAVVVIPGVAARDQRALAGPAMFRAAPGRAALLAVGSLVLVGVLWVIALLLGFFITGPVAAFLTWLVFGCAGVVLVVAWTTLYDRTRATTGA